MLEPPLFAEALNFEPESYQHFADLQIVAETLCLRLRDRVSSCYLTGRIA